MISLNSIEKLLKKQGAELVSKQAKKTFKIILEEHAKEIANKSIKLAKHANRKTIRENDILLAKH
jgi:DNA-binding protein